MGKEKLILAYSGGLDTSVAIAWLKKIMTLLLSVWMLAKVKILILFTIRL